MNEDKIEIQLKGFRFPAQIGDQIRTVAMTVLVHIMGYNEINDALLGSGGMEVSREEYPVTYNIQMEDIRVNNEGVEERCRNAYLPQVKYYMNRVIVKIVGLPKEINMDTFIVRPENHGGSGVKTIKQLIMKDVTYVKENGVEYKNLKKNTEGSGRRWVASHSKKTGCGKSNSLWISSPTKDTSRVVKRT